MEPEIEEQLLASMKRVCDYFDRQRKMQKWAWIILAVFIPTMIGVPLTIEYRKNKQQDAAKAELNKPENWTWRDVRDEDFAGNYKRAIEMAEFLLKKAPNSPADNRVLGRLYLDVGNLKMARKHYQRAFELWPSEEAKKRIEVLDRLEAKTEVPNKNLQGTDNPAAPQPTFEP